MAFNIEGAEADKRGAKFNSVFLHEYWDGTDLRAAIESASQMAKESSTGRYNLMIHKSFEENLQCLINAVDIVSYVQPHKHSSSDDRRETFTVVKGHFWVIEFDKEGKITTKVKLDATDNNAQRSHVIETGVYHTVVSDGPFVTLELKQHPVSGYDPKTDKEFAVDWSPNEKDQNAGKYNDWLLQQVLNS